MELFTEVEFNETELNKIDEVLCLLSKEGWKEIQIDRHTQITSGKGRILKAIKYKWKRII